MPRDWRRRHARWSNALRLPLAILETFVPGTGHADGVARDAIQQVRTLDPVIAFSLCTSSAHDRVDVEVIVSGAGTVLLSGQ
jgi:hypothetical protein